MARGQPPRVRGAVLLKKSGRWAAQICVNRRVLWLGSYAMQADAGVAYDRASLKLGRYTSLNFPSTINTLQEKRFQSKVSFETIVSMIRLKTYSYEYVTFLSNEAIVGSECLADVKSGQQSVAYTGSGVVSEVREPVMLFGVRIG
ncbi:hypothetical protein RDABS01_028069 [Bienertia sinuspersici]